jgi:hypothetical protein
MQKRSRRFELLLPTQFNDGQLVPSEAFVDTLLEIEERFGAVSSETQFVRGQWHHKGQLFRDESIRVFVDVEDTPDNLRFFVEFKERLKVRFQQIDIWMTTYPVEVI